MLPVCTPAARLSLLSLSKGEASVVYADKAYNDYEIEDLLAEVEHIRLLPVRKKNSRRPLSASARYLQSYYRKRVEMAGSQSMGCFPNRFMRSGLRDST